ncbi:glycosyltransferase [Cellulosimicrobium sp. CUA-896]|uniref:glycosyltransferase n=1 Tax=Cellulosimicrobium sp. CUA-896 TaxID=1517881 RepID=UPI0009F92120
MSAGRLRGVLVVVPVHDEEELLPACLASVRHAAARLATERPDLALRVTVVLDGCTDGSADVVRAAGLPALVTPRVGVGAARSLGVAAAARTLPAGAAVARRRRAVDARTWLACTDADSEVPGHWLVRHVELAEAGATWWSGRCGRASRSSPPTGPRPGSRATSRGRRTATCTARTSACGCPSTARRAASPPCPSTRTSRSSTRRGAPARASWPTRRPRSSRPRASSAARRAGTRGTCATTSSRPTSPPVRRRGSPTSR